MMLGAVDTIMLSQYSDESVAAVGVVNQIVMFAFLVFEVINIGTSVLCSQYLGAKMQKNMIQVVGVSLLLNLVVGVLISIILHFGATTLLGWMGLRPELLKYGIGYGGRYCSSFSAKCRHTELSEYQGVVSHYIHDIYQHGDQHGIYGFIGTA